MERKHLRNIIIGVLCLILFFVGIAKICIDMQYNNEKKAIEESKSTVLNTYNRNKDIAKLYLKVYNIRDNATYQTTKNELFDYLSPSMQRELFGTATYEGLDLHKMETSLISVEGTNYPNNEINTFMIKYNLTGVNYDQDITNLIDIKDGEIQRVIRIK